MVRISKEIELVIWDWNGTLFDDAEAALGAVRDLVDEGVGVLPGVESARMTLEEYRRVVEVPIINYYRHYFDTEVLTFDMIQHAFHRDYGRRSEDCSLADGAKELLASLKSRGVRQAMISSFEQESLVGYAKRFGIEGYFDFISGASDRNCESKVERAMAVCRREGIDPGRTVVIGDMLHDFEMAEALGAKAILVCSGHQCREVLSTVGAEVADSLRDIEVEA